MLILAAKNVTKPYLLGLVLMQVVLIAAAE